jgi:hypothetical protein
VAGPSGLLKWAVSVWPVAAMLPWASSAVSVTPAGPVKPPVTVSVAVAGRPPPAPSATEKVCGPAPLADVCWAGRTAPASVRVKWTVPE